MAKNSANKRTAKAKSPSAMDRQVLLRGSKVSDSVLSKTATVSGQGATMVSPTSTTARTAVPLATPASAASTIRALAFQESPKGLNQGSTSNTGNETNTQEGVTSVGIESARGDNSPSSPPLMNNSMSMFPDQDSPSEVLVQSDTSRPNLLNTPETSLLRVGHILPGNDASPSIEIVFQENTTIDTTIDTTMEASTPKNRTMECTGLDLDAPVSLTFIKLCNDALDELGASYNIVGFQMHGFLVLLFMHIRFIAYKI